MPDKKKILVVEDEPVINRILCVRLEINGYDVLSATDGQDGLEKARKENPDLLILDLMLPKVTGFEICRMLRFEERFKNTPIIVLSALGQQDEIDQALREGATAYFVKPFDLEILLDKVKNLLS